MEVSFHTCMCVHACITLNVCISNYHNYTFTVRRKHVDGGHVKQNETINSLSFTSRVPVKGKSSVCVICMKYRIIILIVIISLDQISLSYIANTSCTHTRAHARPSPFRLLLFDGTVVPNHDGVNAPFRLFHWRSIAGRCFIQINSRAGVSVFVMVLGVFRI